VLPFGQSVYSTVTMSDTRRLVTVTPELVARFYRLRDEISGCKNVNELEQLAKQYSYELADMGQFSDPPRLEDLGKILIERFHADFFPRAATLADHAQEIRNITASLREYLGSHDSKMTLIGFGSHAVGTIRSFISDFDGLIYLPPDPREGDLLKGLSSIGLVYSATSTHVQDLDQLCLQGEGLVRLYAMTTSGVEVEFHVIGETDALRLHKQSPGLIKRIRPVSEKLERRTTLGGKSLRIHKSAAEVRNYQRIPGDCITGFFIASVVRGTIVYDGKGLGEKVRSSVLEKYVGGVLHYQNSLSRMPDGRLVIHLENATFDQFLETLYDSDIRRYSAQKYFEQQLLFVGALDQLIAKWRFIQSDRQRKTLVGSDVSLATQRLHAARTHYPRAIVLDFDGTIYQDGIVSYADSARLIMQIREAGIFPIIITARDATMRRDFLPLLQEMISAQRTVTETPVYVGLSNGMAGYCLMPDSIVPLYARVWSQDELATICSTYAKIRGEYGIERCLIPECSLEDFLASWESFVPEDLLRITHQNFGVWVEPSKVTVAASNDPTVVQEMLQALSAQLGDGFEVLWSGLPVIDITPKLPGVEDPKLHGLQQILSQLPEDLTNLQLVTFGDSPFGNDRGILSYPFSFSPVPNPAPQQDGPPYCLEGSCHPVHRVFRAVSFLIK
jgi:hydroxymethylpyrimidine pyrophosphatase-like HAD family hydrolase